MAGSLHLDFNPKVAGDLSMKVQFKQRMKLSTRYLLILGGLPLLTYPIIVIMALFGTLAHRSGNESTPLILVMNSLLFGSFAYPVVYGFCYVIATAKVELKEQKAAVWYAIGPLV